MFNGDTDSSSSCFFPSPSPSPHILPILFISSSTRPVDSAQFSQSPFCNTENQHRTFPTPPGLGEKKKRKKTQQEEISSPRPIKQANTQKSPLAHLLCNTTRLLFFVLFLFFSMTFHLSSLDSPSSSFLVTFVLFYLSRLSPDLFYPLCLVSCFVLSVHPYSLCFILGLLCCTDRHILDVSGVNGNLPL